MKRRRAALAFALATALAAGPAAAASAQTPLLAPNGPTAGVFQDTACIETIEMTSDDSAAADTGFGGASEISVTDGGAAVTLVVEKCEIVPPANPVTTADVGYVGDDGAVLDEAVADSDANCSEWFTPPPSPDGTVYASTCIKWRICGGERLDDVVSGEIAGEATTSRYREYLDELIGLLNADGGGAEADPLDIDSINDFLLNQGFDSRPSFDHLPVFYWCGDRDENFNLIGFDLTTTSFSWDLTYEDVYDIPNSTQLLYVQLAAQLDLFNPEIGLVPAADNGFTFVQYPTWMFLQNESGPNPVFTTNSTNTFRIDLRATLVGVDWSYGSAQLRDCNTDEMLRFDRDNMDATADLPDCHHIFTQLGCQNLTANARFKIEEKVRGRLSATLDDYPDIAWTDYLGVPTVIELTSTLDNYEVHPILSLNAPLGLTRDQVIANARAAGTIPPAADTCNYLNR